MASQLKTIEVKSSKNTMIKAGELIDVVEVTPLTLNDRKIYNLLIRHAEQNLTKPIEHSIDKKALRLSRRGHERIDDSINRLMGGIAKIKTTRNGEPATLRVQLLGRNIEHDRDDGKFYYTFDPFLIEALSDSTVFARLKIDIMMNFQGKYGLALYEMAEKRINLKKTKEEFSLTEIRELLGVPKGKLPTWNNLKTKVFDPAVAEVNQLAVDFRVEINGIKLGKKYIGVELEWWRTSPEGEVAAINELSSPKVGRKARREGTVEELAPLPSKLEHLLTDNALESARKILLKGPNRIGLQNAIQQWEEAFGEKERPDNPNGAFIAFCKKIA